MAQVSVAWRASAGMMIFFFLHHGTAWAEGEAEVSNPPVSVKSFVSMSGSLPISGTVFLCP